MKKYKYHYIMLAPMIVWVFVFWYLPIYGISIAFQKDGKWTLDNFFFLKDREFWLVIYNTLRIAILKMIVSFPAPIILSLLLNEIANKKFKRIIQTVLYMPHFISWVIFAGIIYRLLDPEGGFWSLLIPLLNPLLKIGQKSVLANETSFVAVLVISNLIKEVGWGTIIYLAAISGVDPQLYEAVSLDGGGKWAKMLHVTLPGLVPTIVILAILSLPGLLSAGFDQIWNLQNPMVYSIANVTDVYVLRVGIQKGQYAYGAAMGLIFSSCGLLLVIISNKLSRGLMGHSIW